MTVVDKKLDARNVAAPSERVCKRWRRRALSMSCTR